MQLRSLFRSFAFLLPMLLTGAKKISAQTSSDSCSPMSADIGFIRGSVTLTPKAKIKLDSVYRVMKNYPFCKIRVEGHGASDEAAQQISWDKVASVVRYLRSKGVRKGNFLFNYGLEGDPNNVNLINSTEEGPEWVPAPHPCFSLHLPRKERCVDRYGHMLH